ncbi:MAG TPA: cytochrome c biogenesis protein ResB [Kineosporiaceae bacterium]|nr:cytochrome c biogenesis protein ResB [Kineosporiaceae bacterium]
MSQTVRPSPASRKPAGGKGTTSAGRGNPSARDGRTPTPKKPASRPEPAAEEAPVGFGDALDWLWKFFISRRTGLVLILVLGLMSLAGTLLEQAPGELRNDPQAYAGWLDSVKPKYGGWTWLLDKAGLFGTFSSWWFKGTLVLLTTSIVACSLHRIPQIMRRTGHPKAQPPDAFFDRSGLRAVIPVGPDPEEALALAAKTLRGKHFRAVVHEGGAAGRVSGTALYADRFRWAPYGSIAAHLGFVVVLLGAFLSASTGFKDTQFVAPVGYKVEVGHGTGLQLQALAFNDAYYDNGAPKDYASDLVLYDHGKQVARQTVRVNQPLSYGGVSFYQSFFGTAAGIKVTDAQQNVVSDTAVPLQWQSDDGKHSIGQLVMAAQKTQVYVVLPASGQVDPNIQAGQVQLEVYANGSSTPTATQVISQGKPTTIAGLTYTFQRERQFTGLIVARDPGVWLVWAGSAFLVTGIFLVFFFPYRRLWVLARRGPEGETTLHLAAQLKRDTAFEPQFRELVADLERAAATSTDTAPTSPRK